MTALKTVSMYIRAAKTEAEEAGLATDGMANSVSELRTEILRLTGQKIDIMDGDNYKSTVQVLRELAAIWDELSDTTRTNITEMLGGGVRNANIISALMNSFDTVEEVLEKTADSTGSALEENEKYLDSIAGKTAQFQAAFETLSSTAFSSDVIEGFIESGTELIKILTEIIDKFGALPTVVGTLGIGSALSGETSILSIFDIDGDSPIHKFAEKVRIDTDALYKFQDAVNNTKVKIGSKQSKDDLTTLSKKMMKGTSDEAQKLAEQMIETSVAGQGAKMSTWEYIKALGKQTTESAAAKATQMALNAVYAVTATAIATLVVTAIYQLVTARKRELDQAKEAITLYQEQVDSAEKYKDELSELYETMRSDTSSHEESLAARSRILEIQDDLIASFGDEAASLNLVAMSADQAAAAIDNLTKSQARDNISENATAISYAVDEMERSRDLSFNIDAFLNASSEATDAVKRLVGQYEQIGMIETTDPLTGLAHQTITIKANALEAEEILNSFASDLRSLDLQSNTGSNADEALFSGLASGVAAQLSKVKEIKEEYQGIYDNQIQWKIAAESFTDSTGAVRDYNDVMQELLAAEEEYSEILNKDFGGDSHRQQTQINQAASKFEKIRDALDSYLQDGTMDASVYNYMVGLLSEMQKAASQNKILLEIGFALDGDSGAVVSDPAKTIAKAIKTISGEGGQLKLSDLYAAEQSALNNESGLFTGVELAYFKIAAAADECGMSVDEYAQKLIELGYVEKDTAYKTEAVAGAISSIFGSSSEFGEQFSEVSSKVSSLSDALTKLESGVLTTEEVIALLEEFPELAEYVDLTADGFGNLEEGLRAVGKQIPDKLIDELKKFKETNELTEEAADQIDGLIELLKDVPSDTDMVKDLSDHFGTLADNIARSNKNLTELEEDLAEPDYDYLYQKDADHLAGFKEEMEAGRIGSKHFQYYASYFGVQNKTLEEQKAWISQMEKLYAEGNEGIVNFLKMVEAANDAGILAKDAMMFDSETGEWFFDPARIEESATALGLATGALTNLAEAVNVVLPNKIEPITVSMGVEVDGEQVSSEVVILKEDLAKILDEDALQLILNADGATSDLEVYRDLLWEIAKADPETEVTLDGSIVNVRKALEEIVRLIDWIKNNGEVTVVTGAQTAHSGSGGPLNNTSEVWSVNATGARNHPGGPALLGDEYSPTGEPRPELVVSGDEAYIAGENGPTVQNLKPGDTVYTYDETKRILAGESSGKSILAFSDGTPRKPLPSTKTNQTRLEDAGFVVETAEIKAEEVVSENHGGIVPDLDTITGGTSTSSVSSASSSAYDGDSDALQEAYEKRIAELDHAIFLLEKNGGKTGDIISVYNQLMQAAHEEADRLRALGVAENDEAIMELQQQWWEYHDAIVDIEQEQKDLRDEALEDAKSATEELIDYRIDMLKQDLENQKETLDKEMDAISDFYDEQRDLLNKAKDEKDYEKEQTEKRRAVSDIKAEIDMLKRDDSAWAQKRIAELKSELATAEEELASFEEDRALELALEKLDSQEESQLAQLETEIEAIDAMLNDPEALYNRALVDIQNNSKALYDEMVAFNNKYGSGNPDDIAEMWSEAFDFFNKYIETYGEPYKGITLTDVSGYASGTSHAIPGFHKFDEAGAGSETIFTAEDGTRYRMFRGGDKVLNPAGTDFLYNFAETHGGNLTNTIGDMINGLYMKLISGLQQKTIVPEIIMGDIIVQGNADEKTVSQIRREQRNSVEFMLKELNKLKS